MRRKHLVYGRQYNLADKRYKVTILVLINGGEGVHPIHTFLPSGSPCFSLQGYAQEWAITLAHFTKLLYALQTRFIRAF
jgi:hypothetical protein